MKSEFAELKVPVVSPQNKIPGLYLLTLDGAMRHEEYSDGNKTTVPKISLRYLPYDDELALRATYAKSFTAPTLYDLYGPSASGFTTGLGGLNAYNSSGVRDRGQVRPPAGLPDQRLQSSPHPVEGQEQDGFGVIYSPKYAKGLEVTVDYYQIKQTDLIGSPGRHHHHGAVGRSVGHGLPVLRNTSR